MSEPEGPERPIKPPDDVPPVSAEDLVAGEVAGGAAGERADDAPEEPEERRYPSTIGGAFYLVALLAVTVGVVVTVLGSWRLGIRIMGGALMGSAVVRLVLPARDAGMLAVRHKGVDAALLVALGVALVFLAGSIPEQPDL